MPTRAVRRRRGESEPLGRWWQVTYAVLYWPVTGLFGVRYENVDRLPASGPVIIAANHVSHVDPLILSKFLLDAGRVPRFLAKDSIFRVKVVGRFMTGMGHVPVTRGSIEAAQSLAAAVAALGRGQLIMMYPEGTVTRDPDGWPMTARTGTARLALEAPDAPVIPIGQWGVQQSVDLYRKKVRLVPRPRHTIRVGDPVDLSAYRESARAGGSPSQTTLAEMTDVIMRAVRDEVAVVRGVPAPTGPFYRWKRSPQRRAGERRRSNPRGEDKSA